MYVWGETLGCCLDPTTRLGIGRRNTHTLSQLLGKLTAGFPPRLLVVYREMIPHSSPPLACRLPEPAATRVTIIIIGFRRRRRPYPLEEELAAMAMAAMRQRSSRSRGIVRRRQAIPSDANCQQRSTSLVLRNRRRRYQDHRPIVTVRLQPARWPDKVNTLPDLLSSDECPGSLTCLDLGCSENPDDMTSNTAVTLQNGFSNMHQKTYPAQQLHPAFSIPPCYSRPRSTGLDSKRKTST